MKTNNKTLAEALRHLAKTIQAPDSVPSACLHEAACRIDEMADVIDKQAQIIARLEIDADPQALTIAYMQGHMDGRASRPIKPTEN